jgi:signal recognition particle GTPase
MEESKQLHKSVIQLQQASNQQEKHIETITRELNFYKQKLLEQNVAISGVPDLSKIKPETVLEKLGET